MGQENSYRGVTYLVEAVQVNDGAWRGHFRLQGVGAEGEGEADALHPSLDTVWATENEAMNYATEAACHAIEILQEGRPQGQGHGSPSSERRTTSLGL